MQRLFRVPEAVVDKKYTGKLRIPQYTPSSNVPQLYELVDKTKYMQLVRSIELADIPEDVKIFLKCAASRHLVFNYSKIADYYAGADAQVQKLMEESALVIIDIDDAIANGYVRLSDTIKKIMTNTGEGTNA